MMSILTAPLLAFIGSVISITLLMSLAHKVALTDAPCERKRHAGQVPLVGGLGFYISSALVLVFTHPSIDVFILLGVSACLVAMASVDDAVGLGVKSRLYLQMLCAAAMFYLGDVQLLQLQNLVGTGLVEFSPVVGFFFTLFCTIGVINAFNMIDGADGLAGSLALLSLCALGYSAYTAGAHESARILFVFSGSVAAFLLFNIRFGFAQARVFMGDAGSMLLGFLLAWFCIKLSQPPESGEVALSEVSAGWILGLPLLDACAVMINRAWSGKAPFHAGRDHIHHLLIDGGMSVNRTLIVLTLFHCLFVLVGLAVNSMPDGKYAFFWIFIIAALFYTVGTRKYKCRKVKSTSNAVVVGIKETNSEC